MEYFSISQLVPTRAKVSHPLPELWAWLWNLDMDMIQSLEGKFSMGQFQKQLIFGISQVLWGNSNHLVKKNLLLSLLVRSRRVSSHLLRFFALYFTKIETGDLVNITIAAGTYSTFPILETVLQESTIIDLTSEVVNGFLSWAPPKNGSYYALIAFYERYTNQRSCIGGVNATDFVGNGSWIVDHFSAAGSGRTTDFLDQHLIYDEVKVLLEDVGEYCLSPRF